MRSGSSPLRRVLERALAAPSWLTSRMMALVWLRSCSSVGTNTRTFFRPHIENLGRITIGNGVRLNSNWAPLELVTGPQGSIEIGDGVYINYGTLVSASRSVRIGANVMVGNYAIISDTEIPGIDMPAGGPEMEPRAVDIGDGAWLAARVTVLPGARIGAGAVIAAGSVVAGEIPAGTVAGGIPARVLRPAGASTSAEWSATVTTRPEVQP
jgi:carbonic anhydrase/acetyltransferase-like protein (isoleucine patch superfamily)